MALNLVPLSCVAFIALALMKFAAGVMLPRLPAYRGYLLAIRQLLTLCLYLTLVAASAATTQVLADRGWFPDNHLQGAWFVVQALLLGVGMCEVMPSIMAFDKLESETLSQ